MLSWLRCSSVPLQHLHHPLCTISVFCLLTFSCFSLAQLPSSRTASSPHPVHLESVYYESSRCLFGIHGLQPLREFHLLTYLVSAWNHYGSSKSRVVSDLVAEQVLLPWSALYIYISSWRCRTLQLSALFELYLEALFKSERENSTDCLYRDLVLSWTHF